MHDTSHSPFPADFTWGAATASYQIEGAAHTDGRGLSVWDTFSSTPGCVLDGHTGEIACDHYHRYKEDVSLMAEIGLQAYRFSFAWPRILPGGTGKPNPKGMAFYDRLIDSLLAKGIQPWATLFHWDFPYELYLRGGWLNRESSDWFAGYVRCVMDAFSDRISHWLTLNEPQCFIGLGHNDGAHAPGLKLSRAEVLLAGHNALLAHGKAVQVIRAHARTAPKIGWAPVGVSTIPASESEEDIAAARQVTLNPAWTGIWSNTWWADAPVLGQYPEEALRMLGRDAPKIQPGDMETICQPLDFYGCNTYTADVYRADAEGLPQKCPPVRGWPESHFHWRMLPDALYWGPKFLHERYKLPIIITENGLSNADWVSRDGKVHDPQRIDFLSRYIEAVGRAIRDGVPVKGYFVWSLMDNFEWAEGYRHRFGLIHVDYTTLKRTMKDSAYWYAQVIATDGASIAPLRPEAVEMTRNRSAHAL